MRHRINCGERSAPRAPQERPGAARQDGPPRNLGTRETQSPMEGWSAIGDSESGSRAQLSLESFMSDALKTPLSGKPHASHRLFARGALARRPWDRIDHRDIGLGG